MLHWLIIIIALRKFPRKLAYRHAVKHSSSAPMCKHLFRRNIVQNRKITLDDILYCSREAGMHGRATFLLTSFIGMHRYHKLRMSDKIRPDSQAVDDVRILLGPLKYSTLPLFDNTPYLRRFRVNGRLFITSCVNL